MKHSLLTLLICLNTIVTAPHAEDVPQDPGGAPSPAAFPKDSKPSNVPQSGKTPPPQQAAIPKPRLTNQPEFKYFATKTVEQNGAKNALQTGTRSNEVNQAQYQATTAQTQAAKAKLDDMAASGKYDTKGYYEALTALSIPATSFNYQPPQSDSEDTAPSPTSRSAPVAETTKIPGFSSPAATTDTPALPVPSSELADTRVPVDYSGRAPAAASAPSPANPSSNVPSSPASSFPSFAPPALIAPPDSALTPQGNSLQQLESAPSNSGAAATKGNSGSLTQSAPARGLSSVTTDEEPSEAEIAAAVSRKIADDHKRKVADAKAGKKGDKTKPTLADRLKGSGVVSTPDEHTPSPVPVAPSAVWS